MNKETNEVNATETVQTPAEMLVPYASAVTQPFWEDVKSGKAGIRIPTGFPDLDKLLDGGLRVGMNVLMAAPGAGKTTLCLQMMDNFTRAGWDVIFFSGEMPVEDLLAKNYSRCSYVMDDESLRMTAGDILKLNENPYVNDIANALCEAYRPVAEKTVVVPPDQIKSAKAIWKIVSAHIAATGNRPVVCIDYLQVLASKFGEATDKQNVDKFLNQLKELARRYEIPVLLISSVNRMSYKESLSLGSGKESGDIEYNADVLLGLEEPKSGKEENNDSYAEPKGYRLMRIKSMKSRLAPRGIVNLKMYAAYNYFEEEKGSPSSASKRHGAY